MAIRNQVLPRAIFALVAMFAFPAGVLFASAGRIDIPQFWMYSALVGIVALIGVIGMDPGLFEERMRPGAGGIDRRLSSVATPLIVAHLIIAGLDVGRYHWSDSVPSWLRWAGLAGVAAGFGIAMWAMQVNRFFSPVVRIQEERGHHLITTGPYAIVRHPGYSGAIVAFLSGAFGLGSWWSMAPLAAASALILRRILMEDDYLHEHLEGYANYAQRVRYRLIPGVW